MVYGILSGAAGGLYHLCDVPTVESGEQLIVSWHSCLTLVLCEHWLCTWLNCPALHYANVALRFLVVRFSSSSSSSWRWHSGGSGSVIGWRISSGVCELRIGNCHTCTVSSFITWKTCYVFLGNANSPRNWLAHSFTLGIAGLRCALFLGIPRDRCKAAISCFRLFPHFRVVLAEPLFAFACFRLHRDILFFATLFSSDCDIASLFLCAHIKIAPATSMFTCSTGSSN